MRRGLPTLALAACAALGAASAAPPATSQGAAAPPLVGGPHGAYRAAPLPSSFPRPPVYDAWWFSGTQADQVNKLANAPTATFTRTKPSGTSDIQQAATPVGVENAVADPFSVYWRAPYSGTIDGDLLFSWYWTTADPEAQLRAEVIVTVFADAEVGSTAAQIGRRNVVVNVAPDPLLTRNRVPVHGHVNRSLLIQVTLRYMTIAPELRAVYGSQAHPAGFVIPRPTAGAQDRPATTAVAFAGERLDVQAVDVGRESAEPTIGVDRRGGAFYAAAAYELGFGLPSTRVLRSVDGGGDWEDVSPLLGGESVPPMSADPYVYVDPMTDRVFSIDLYAACAYLAYTDDQGATWEANPLACGEPGDDHQTLVSGPPPPGLNLRSEYGNVIYYCFNQVARSGCTRSVDGGATFEPGLSDPYPGVENGQVCGGLHGRAVTDSRGRLFLPKGHCHNPWMAMSEDGGDTWRRAPVTREVSTAGEDVQAAVDEADNVYVTWWDEDLRLPWMSVSRDHGATWGTPLLISPPDVKAVNFPSIAAGAAGRVAVTFPGTTSDIERPNRPWDSYVILSTNALDPTPVFQSATANRPGDPIHRGECVQRCGLMLDFLHAIVSSAGEVWATAVDTCTAEEDCVTNNDPESETSGAVSGVGLAIRQRCGPALRGPARSLHGDGCVTVGAAPSSGPPPGKRRGLPRTTE